MKCLTYLFIFLIFYSDIVKADQRLFEKIFNETKDLIGYYENVPLPEIEFGNPQEISSTVCVPPCEIHGYYLPGTVVLNRTWNDNDPYHMSVLVHEFVHYIQDLRGQVKQGITCDQRKAIELEAYNVQNAWLTKFFNRNLDYNKVKKNIEVIKSCNH